MEKEIEKTYDYYFNKKEHEAKSIFSMLSAISFIVLLGYFLLRPVYNSFNGKLIPQGEVTFSGMVFIMWCILVVGSSFFGICFSFYMTSVLAELKKTLQLSWAESVLALKTYNEESFETYFLAIGFIVAALAVPLVYILPFPSPFPMFMRVFGLFLFTFMYVSLVFGFRDSIFMYLYTKTNTPATKEQTMPEQLSTNSTAQSELLALFSTNVNQPVYQLPHFQTEVTKIIASVHALIRSTTDMNAEQTHVINRVLQEELPAILHTYESLDDHMRQQLTPHFMECLQKIQSEINRFHDFYKDIRQLDAHTVIETIKKRY